VLSSDSIVAKPPVRQKAVVRFSRKSGTYTVNYDQFDGGGILPGGPTSRNVGALAPTNMQQLSQALGVASLTNVKEVRRLLRAPVLERIHADPDDQNQADGKNVAEEIPHGGQGVELKPSDDTAGRELVHVSPEISHRRVSFAPEESREDCADAPTPPSKDSSEAHVFEDSEASEGEGDICNRDPIDPEMARSVLPDSAFVRAWGILTEWCSPLACEVLHSASFEHDEDELPKYASRRALLFDILGARIPAELGGLAPALQQFTRAMGAHQPLPLVTEAKMYDFLASLLLKVILELEMNRGRCSADTYGKTLLQRQLQSASQALNLTDEEVRILEATIRGRSGGIVPIQSV